MACCGGFTCSKNSLIALNMLYLIIAFVLIGVAAYAKVMDYLSSFAILGGIIGCGVFLLLIGIMGLYGAAKHHQICLFFYMVILFLLFVVQFALAVAMLAITDNTRDDLLKEAWARSDNDTRRLVEQELCCCGYNASGTEPLTCQKPLPDACKCDTSSNPKGKPCRSCDVRLREFAGVAVKSTGGVGLFFSFTEAIGVFLALRYRNMKNPLADPDAFL